MFGPKVRIDQELYEKLQKCAEAAGYSSTEEFIKHTLEKAVADLMQGTSEDELKQRLQGLGYLD